MMTKTIIFDYDGTIHHTLGIYEPAFRETYQWLTEQKAAEEREVGYRTDDQDGRRPDDKTDQET